MREYYSTLEYALNQNLDQTLAKDFKNNEVYLRKLHIDVLPKKHSGEIFYAKSIENKFILPLSKGKPFYAFEGNHPIFPKLNEVDFYGTFKNSEIYPVNSFGTIYLKDRLGNEIYCKNHQNRFYYGWTIKDDQKIQYFAQTADGKDIPLYDNDGNFIYLLNLSTNRPIYKKDSKMGEIYEKNSKGIELYGKNNLGLPVYCKSSDNHDLVAFNNNVPYYCGYNNYEFYPKFNNKSQYFIRIQNRQIYCQKALNDYYYPKNLSGRELLGLNEYNNEYYCTTSDSSEKYPKNSNMDEFYRIENSRERIALNKNKEFFYARSKTGNILYPCIYDSNIER